MSLMDLSKGDIVVCRRRLLTIHFPVLKYRDIPSKSISLPFPNTARIKFVLSPLPSWDMFCDALLCVDDQGTFYLSKERTKYYCIIPHVWHHHSSLQRPLIKVIFNHWCYLLPSLITNHHNTLQYLSQFPAVKAAVFKPDLSSSSNINIWHLKDILKIVKAWALHKWDNVI